MFTKREIASLIGVVASIIIPKLIFPDEFYEVVEPLPEDMDTPEQTDYANPNESN